jgi:tetratricopeptide (TPR) repeat protein
MKHFIICSLSVFAFFHSSGQTSYKPASQAKQLNDDAINKYVKYSASPDSVASVIRLLNEAIAIDNNYYTAWANKLEFECGLKSYDNALATAKKMEQLFPDETAIPFLKGLLQYKTGHKQDATATFGKLLQQYNAALSINKNGENIYNDLVSKALVLMLLDRPEEAKDILKNLTDAERDPTVKKHLAAYMNTPKDKLVTDLIASRK